MIGAYYEDWERKRSDLSHNWLSNDYLDQLKALNAYMLKINESDEIRYRYEIKRLVIEKFSQWVQKKEDIIKLIKNIESELSPIKLLEVYPMEKLNNRIVDWIKPLIHQLWMLRKNVSIETESLLNLCNSINIGYIELKTEYDKIDIIRDRIPETCYKKLDEYISLCGKLSSRLSEIALLEKVV